MKKYKIFFLQGFESSAENGNLKDVVTFELIDTTYEKALARAKKIYPKKLYRLSAVVEKYIEC